MEENENFAYTYTQKIISQVVSDVDKETIKAITRYCEENNVYPNLISEERIKEIIEIGLKSEQLQQELSIANDKLKKIDNQAKTQISIIKSQPSPNKEADDYFVARLETISKIIEGND